MFLVIGITGKTGGSVARQLLAQGKRVRAMVRERSKAAHWEHEGVDLVEGDIHDVGSFTRALQGASAAYVMLPSVPLSRDYRASKALVATCAQAIQSVPLEKLVVLSSIGADKSEGIGPVTTLAMLERALREIPCPMAFIRPGMFYENFLYGLQEGANGTFTVFFEKTGDAFPTAATEDIGVMAAKLLVGPAWPGVRIVELGTRVTIDELAHQIGQVLGRDVKARSLPREAWDLALSEMGVPSDQAWAIKEMYEALNSHWIDFGGTGVEHIESRTLPRDVFLAAHLASRG